MITIEQAQQFVKSGRDVYVTFLNKPDVREVRIRRILSEPETETMNSITGKKEYYVVVNGVHYGESDIFPLSLVHLPTSEHALTYALQSIETHSEIIQEHEQAIEDELATAKVFLVGILNDSKNYEFEYNLIERKLQGLVSRGTITNADLLRSIMDLIKMLQQM